MRREAIYRHDIYEGYFHVWSQEYIDEWEIEDCGACLMTLNFGEEFFRLGCEHILHADCVMCLAA